MNFCMQCKGFEFSKLIGLGKASRIVSIYLSNAEFRAVAIEEASGLGVEYAYGKSFEFDAAGPWYEKEEALAEQLKQVKKELHQEEYDFAKAAVIVAIDEATYVEGMELPYLEKQELEEAVAWELPQRIPWEQGSYQYVYKSKGKRVQKEEEKLADIQEITVYSLPKRHLELIQGAMQEAELVAEGIFAFEELEQEDGDYGKLLPEVDFYESFYNVEKLEELRSYYAKALLAGFAYLTMELKIDFLSKAGKQQALLKKSAGLCYGLAAFFLCLSIVGGLTCLAGLQYEEHKLQKAKESYYAMEPWEQKMEDYITLEQGINSLQKTIKAVKEEQICWSKEIIAIGRCLPKGCWLTEIEQQTPEENKPTKLVINGRAEESGLVVRYLEQLRQLDGFNKVEMLKGGQEEKNERFSFKSLESFKIVVELKSKGSLNKLVQKNGEEV